MLGAVQVAATTSTGDRLGYSGDFSWPLESVIQVESLVLDSTYGDPNSIRHYSQEDANDCFKEIILRQIKLGPIIIKAHRGTLYRAYELLNGLVPNPIIANKKKIEEAKVCEKHGYCVCPMYDLDLPDVKRLRKEGPYIGLYYLGEQIPFDHGDTTVINLTAYWVHGKEPFLELSDSSYQVAMSDHADFNETLEYVQATHAKAVLTDSLRSSHANELASAIRRSLGIAAKPAKPVYSRDWGV
jgi:putative mRNA 3-end processing factor